MVIFPASGANFESDIAAGMPCFQAGGGGGAGFADCALANDGRIATKPASAAILSVCDR
jgi:hypothetical protein